MIKTAGLLTISKINSSFGEDKDKVSISVKDEKSRIRFLKIQMSLEEFSKCLLGLAFSDCSLELNDLNYVGKKLETKTLKFPVNVERYDIKCKEIARKEVYNFLPSPDWMPDLGFNSRDSFFKVEDTTYAITTIRRWVDD